MSEELRIVLLAEDNSNDLELTLQAVAAISAWRMLPDRHALHCVRANAIAYIAESQRGGGLMGVDRSFP